MLNYNLHKVTCHTCTQFLILFKGLLIYTLELCPYPWILELGEPTKAVVLTFLIPHGDTTLKIFTYPYPSYPVLKFGNLLPISNCDIVQNVIVQWS